MELELENIPDTDWARLAAYIDGEGCISLNRTKRKDGECYAYRPTITIGNTSFALMDWLRFMFNFSIYTRRTNAQSHFGNKTNYYAYTSHKASIITILNNVLPFLIVKADHAITLLTFWSDKEALWISGAKVPEFVEEKRFQIYLRMRSLNS